MLEAEALETQILYPDGIKISKVEEETSYQRSLSTVETANKVIEETLVGDTVEWFKTWHARYLE